MTKNVGDVESSTTVDDPLRVEATNHSLTSTLTHTTADSISSGIGATTMVSPEYVAANTPNKMASPMQRLLSTTVETLQSIRVSSNCCRGMGRVLRRRTNGISSSSDPSSSLPLVSTTLSADSLQQPQTREATMAAAPEGIPLISGLDRVVFGTVSAAEAVLICNVKPPQYLFYMVSGSACDIIQFLLDYMIHIIINVQDASTCWALSLSLSVYFRHTSHRYLVFGNYVGGYWNSLLRMYGGYSFIIVLSTLFNMFMTKYAQLPHYVAWIITLLWTGIVNFFILKKLWSFGGTAGGSK